MSIKQKVIFIAIPHLIFAAYVFIRNLSEMDLLIAAVIIGMVSLLFVMGLSISVVLKLLIPDDGMGISNMVMRIGLYIAMFITTVFGLAGAMNPLASIAAVAIVVMTAVILDYPRRRDQNREEEEAPIISCPEHPGAKIVAMSGYARCVMAGCDWCGPRMDY